MHPWQALLSSLLLTCDELFPQIETVYGVPSQAIITPQMLLDDRIQWYEDHIPYSELLAILIPDRIALAEGTNNEFVRSHDLNAISAIVHKHSAFIATIEEVTGGPMPGSHLRIQPAASAPKSG